MGEGGLWQGAGATRWAGWLGRTCLRRCCCAGLAQQCVRRRRPCLVCGARYRPPGITVFPPTTKTTSHHHHHHRKGVPHPTTSRSRFPNRLVRFCIWPIFALFCITRRLAFLGFFPSCRALPAHRQPLKLPLTDKTNKTSTPPRSPSSSSVGHRPRRRSPVLCSLLSDASDPDILPPPVSRTDRPHTPLPVFSSRPPLQRRALFSSSCGTVYASVSFLVVPPRPAASSNHVGHSKPGHAGWHF